MSGRAFGVGEWLGQLAFYGAYLAGGWSGIVVLRAALLGVAAGFATRVARSTGAPLLLWLPLLVTSLAISKITWTDRPHLFTFALFPLLLDLLLQARAGRRRLLFALPPLFALWSNLHGGHLLGVAVAGAFAVEALLLRRGGAPFALAVAASYATTFLNPAPVDLGVTAREDLLSPPRFLVEFLPPDVLEPAGALFAAIAVAWLASALLRPGRSPLELLLLPPLLWLGLSAQRHMAFFAIAVIPFLAPRLPAPRLSALPHPARGALALVLAAAALTSALGAPSAPDDSAYPVAALGALDRTSGVLLNEYDWGGFLIWRAPAHPVFIDGRYVPYLGGVLEDYRQAVALRPRWREVLERYRVARALLRPERPLVAALREEGWTLRAQGAGFVLLARP